MIYKAILKIFFVFICMGSAYLNAQPDAVYRIKLMTVGLESDLRIFNNLKDLGTIIFEPYGDDKLRVYLGNYIGKLTADKILPTVLQRGFKGAFLEKVGNNFINNDGDTLTHSVQFTALKKLDIRTIINNPKLSETDKSEVFIWYYNGFYRVSLGLVNDTQIERIDNYKAKSQAIGYMSFVQKFAGIEPIAEKQSIQPIKKNIPTLPNAKKLETKDDFELELKKSGTIKSKPNSSKGPVDPILIPKEAKINPNAKLNPIKK